MGTYLENVLPAYQCTLGWWANVPHLPFDSIPHTPRKGWLTCDNNVSSDLPWTNAGMGSNLTVSETVECDASIMDGHTLWCCWSCARCEESYPCSQMLATKHNDVVQVGTSPLQHMPLRRVENTMYVKTC